MGDIKPRSAARPRNNEAKMPLRINDIIPLGVGPGFVSLLANDNGLLFVPRDAQVSTTRGGSGYFEVKVAAKDNKDAAILRLLGVPAADIRRAKELEEISDG